MWRLVCPPASPATGSCCDEPHFTLHFWERSPAPPLQRCRADGTLGRCVFLDTFNRSTQNNPHLCPKTPGANNIYPLGCDGKKNKAKAVELKMLCWCYWCVMPGSYIDLYIWPDYLALCKLCIFYQQQWIHVWFFAVASAFWKENGIFWCHKGHSWSNHVSYCSETSLLTRWLHHLLQFLIISAESPVKCWSWLILNPGGRNKHFSGIILFYCGSFIKHTAGIQNENHRLVQRVKCISQSIYLYGSYCHLRCRPLTTSLP